MLTTREHLITPLFGVMSVYQIGIFNVKLTNEFGLMILNTFSMVSHFKFRASDFYMHTAGHNVTFNGT